MGTDRHEDCVEPALHLLLREVGDHVVDNDRDAEVRHPGDLRVEDVPGQAVLGDAVPHHAARLGSAVADLDLVAEQRQLVGR
jgi:hypothetical protein